MVATSGISFTNSDVCKVNTRAFARASWVVVVVVVMRRHYGMGEGSGLGGIRTWWTKLSDEDGRISMPY